MKILLISAYDAVSHRQWREQLVDHLGEWDWTVLTLPPRFFAWRSRGNPLSLAFGHRDVLAAGYDLVLATSMTTLAELKGIVPELSGIPSVVYFHENQFVYPERHDRLEGQSYRFNNLYTALSADRVLFNSDYNRHTFLTGAGELLKTMPDLVPPGIIESVKECSRILPVPLHEKCFVGKAGNRNKEEGKELQLVWNHRWEYDKAPERFFNVLFRMADEGVPFKVHVMGQQFRDRPEIFNEAEKRLADNILTWGFAEEEAYRHILSSSDIAVSTALHDFQGLALLEAVAAGCIPIVPDRLAYRELIPEEFRYLSFENDAAVEEQALYERLRYMCENPASVRKTESPDVSHLSWEVLGPLYRRILEETAGGSRKGDL